LEGLAKDDVGNFRGHLVYFTAIGYILWAFGNLLVIWYIFPHFGVLYQEKSGNPGPLATKIIFHDERKTFGVKCLGQRYS
jgi:hypothetical protein